MDVDVLPRGDVYREKYEVVERTGAGGFGKVFSVKNKLNKSRYYSVQLVILMLKFSLENNI